MPLVTATFSTGGNVIINDTVEVAAIGALTEVMAEFTALAANIPGTPAANIAAMAESLNDISGLLTDVVEQQQEINQNLQLISRSMSRISSNIGMGVTTNQLAYLDQAKNNQFTQQQSNAALERAGLPPTEVKQGDFNTRVTTTIKDVGDLQLQSKVVGLTQDGLDLVQELATDYGSYLIEEALDATGISGLWNQAKEKFNELFPSIADIRKKVAQANAARRATQTGRPNSPLPGK